MRIKTVRVIASEDVYDISVETNHNFYANGILVHNCVEIGLYGYTEDGESGIQFCNLTEGNGKYCDTVEKFMDVCRALAILGTLQAAYTDFNYLSSATKKITDREALLGCSMTGLMDNPDILLDPANQRAGVKLMKKTNERLAKIIGINPAARISAVKPAGTTSCVLGTANGHGPHHAERYVRLVQGNKNEFPVQMFEKINPSAVTTSVWDESGNTKCIAFLCEIPKGAIRKNQLSAVEMLSKVKSTQANWVKTGTVLERCVKPWLCHNVSNTITVRDNEWDEVTNYIYENRSVFAGVSLLAASGDLDYPQAPFTAVLLGGEIAKEYGDGSALASGLIVDGLRAFKDNLWTACERVLDTPEKAATRTTNVEQRDWIRRAKQFSSRYFEGNDRRMTHCLKHVAMLKIWLDLKREYKDIDWSTVVENAETHVAADTLGAQACAGGSCEVV